MRPDGSVTWAQLYSNYVKERYMGENTIMETQSAKPIIDLHMHTTASDGTDTPAEILCRVRASGLKLFSVTDHDAIKGCEEILPALTAGDPAFLTGVEFSCRDEEGQYHILGYGYDPTTEPIRQVVELGHSYRMNKLKGRLDYLKSEFGVSFSEEELEELYALDNPGKPHIGNLMVKDGYAQSKDEAIRNFIDKLHYRSQYVRPEEAIEGILGSGGIPVLAHPAYGNGDQLILGEDMDKRLRKLIGFGLKGMEVYYSGFTTKLRDQMLAFAERYGLYITAGSDYHGSNKLVVLGDTSLGDDPEEWPEGLKRFLADAGVEAFH